MSKPTNRGTGVPDDTDEKVNFGLFYYSAHQVTLFEFEEYVCVGEA